MELAQGIKIVIALSLFTSFYLCKHVGEVMAGRIGRRRYITRQVIIFAVFSLLSMGGMMGIKPMLHGEDTTIQAYIILYFFLCAMIFVLWFLLTSDVKRLHDVNLHGAFAVFLYASLLLAVQFKDTPVIMAGVYLAPRLLFCVLPGSKKVNKYGHNHDKNYIF